MADDDDGEVIFLHEQARRPLLPDADPDRPTDRCIICTMTNAGRLVWYTLCTVCPNGILCTSCYVQQIKLMDRDDWGQAIPHPSAGKCPACRADLMKAGDIIWNVLFLPEHMPGRAPDGSITQHSRRDKVRSRGYNKPVGSWPPTWIRHHEFGKANWIFRVGEGKEAWGLQGTTAYILLRPDGRLAPRYFAAPAAPGGPPIRHRSLNPNNGDESPVILDPVWGFFDGNRGLRHRFWRERIYERSV